MLSLLDFYMFTVLTSPPLHGMSSFLVGVPPILNEATHVEKIHFSTACCFPYSTPLHPSAYGHNSQSWGQRRQTGFPFYPEL